MFALKFALCQITHKAYNRSINRWMESMDDGLVEMQMDVDVRI